MNKPTISKDDLIQQLIEGQLMHYVTKHQLVKKGERFTYGSLLSISAEDIKKFLDRRGYPSIKDSEATRLPYHGDWETIWTLEDGLYCAVWLERGTTTTLFSTPSREDFQAWWNAHLLEEYTGALDYPWTA
jgi:hypothetical protein